MNSPKNTHVKVRLVNFHEPGDGQILKEKTDQIKVFTITAWKSMQDLPGLIKKFEFIEEIPHPDPQDILSLEATGGKETGPWKRYEEWKKAQGGLKAEEERKSLELAQYNERKADALRELVAKFKGKQELHMFLASIGIAGDISANMVDEINLGTMYEKFQGNMPAMIVAIDEWMDKQEIAPPVVNTGTGTADEGIQRAQAIKSWTARFKSKKQLGEFATHAGVVVDGTLNMMEQGTQLYEQMKGDEASFNEKIEAFLAKA